VRGPARRALRGFAARSRWQVVCLSLLLGACAAPQPSAPPPVRIAASVSPSFEVPSRRERMVTLARQEWALFGSPEVRESGNGTSSLSFAPGAAATHELQGPMLTRVLAYWYAVSPAPIVGHQGELRPWSAAFIAWLAQAAGYRPQEFPPTVLHWDYIERFINPSPWSPFVARDPALHAPSPGDLVCNARNDEARPDFDQQVDAFSALRRGPYHCDLVVERDARSIRVIGGNVSDTVAMTALPIDGDGRLRADLKRRWVVVLEHRLP